MAKKQKAPFSKGDQVTFKGYTDEVAEDEQLLTEGEQYEVVDVNEDEGSVVLQLDNPDFNPKKKESEDNPRLIQVDAFFDEVEIAAEEGEAEEEEEETKPAPKAKTAAKPAAKGKPAAKEADDANDEEEQEEKPAAKGKATAKAAPAKGKAKEEAKPAAKGKAKADPKAKAKAKPAKEEKEEIDESEVLPALENEDEEIVELVNGAEDLVALAQELTEDSAALDYKLGGVLYHTRLGKAYQAVDKKYAVKGGWQLFIDEQLPGLGYRKAMHLIDIYYKFNLFGIDAAKVAELGWTKCSKIAQVMTEENAEELVELAAESSVADLSATIQESYNEVGGTKGDKRKKIAFKFRLWDDQAEGVKQVLAHVCTAMSFKDESDAFEHIVMEWAAEHDIEVAEAKPAAKAGAKAAAKTDAKAAPKAAAKARARA